jgi:hypothetical protein
LSAYTGRGHTVRPESRSHSAAGQHSLSRFAGCKRWAGDRYSLTAIPWCVNPRIDPRRSHKSGDINIAYATAGDGPFDLVFVNGWVLSALEYASEGPAADFFRELASFSRLSLFDKRGTGLSDELPESQISRRGWTTSAR